MDLLAPLTWSQGLSGNAAVQFGGNKGAGNWSAGIAADIYQKYRIAAQLHRLLRRLLDRPDRPTRRRRHGRAQRHDRVAVRPRLGVAHVQDHLLTRNTIMFRKTLMALAIAALGAARRVAAVSADEAKQLGTTLTRGRRREGRQQGRHDPRVHRRHQARPPSFKTGTGVPPRSVRRARSRASRSPARTWRRRPTS